MAHFWIFRDKVENAFIWGVVFFAVAHIFYIIAFKLRNKGDFFNKTLKFSLILFFVSLFVLLGLFFGNGMGEILNLICVVVYGIIICACVFSVLSFAYNDKSYVSMINLIGVILFFLSDFLIGINIMGGIDFPGRGQWVWILYPLGQLMLIFDIKETS